MAFRDALKSVSLCFREEEEGRDDKHTDGERERERGKAVVSFLSRATHFLETKNRRRQVVCRGDGD